MKNFLGFLFIILIVVGLYLGRGFLSNLTTSMFAPQSQVVSDTGLVGYWDMNLDGGASGTVKDMSRDSNDKTNVGATPIEGKIGSALHFDGTDDSIGGSDLTISKNAVSFSAWIKFDDTSGTLSAQAIGMFSSGPQARMLVIYSTSKFAVRWLTEGGPNTYYLSNTAMSEDTWHHVVFTYSAVTEELIGYLDGVKGITNTSVTAAGDFTNLYIGRGSSYDYFEGSIDEARIYDTVLTEAEVAALYNEGNIQGKLVLNAQEASGEGLVGWWSLDSDSETIGSDLITNGDFSLWTDPTFPDGWTKSGTHDANNYVEESSSGGIRLVSDGTGVGIRHSILEEGKRYRVTYDVLSVDVDEGKFDYGPATISLDTVGSFSTEITAGSSTFFTFYRRAVGVAADVTIDNVAVYEIQTEDITSNGNHGGIIQDATVYVADHHGNANRAMDFDGTSDYVEISADDTLDFSGSTESFSLSAWVKFTGADNGDAIIDHRDANDDGWRMIVTTAGAIYGSINGTDAISATGFGDNTWHHAFFSADRTGNGQMYVDGVASGNAVDISGLTMDITTPLITLGKITYAAPWFDSSIADVRIYNRALSASEIAEVYNSYSPGIDFSSYRKGEVGHWPLTIEQSNGTTVKDLGSGGNDGTATSVTIGDRSSYFDGADSKIDTGSDSIGTGADSFAAWIYVNSGYVGPDRIISNGDAGGYRVEWSVYNDKLYFRSLSSDVTSAENSIQADTWYHIVVARDAAGLATFYINGVQSANANQNSGMPTAGSNVIIGNNYAGSVTFDGKIADVRHWDRVLTASEVALLYSHGRPNTSVDRAADFDGSTQYLSLADGANAGDDFDAGTDDFAVELWIKTTVGSSGNNNPIIGKYLSTATKGSWDMNVYVLGRAYFYIKADSTDGTQSYVADNSSIADGAWHHLVMTRVDNLLEGFVDGVSIGTDSGMTSGKSLDNDRDLIIGGRASNDKFEGAIDNIRIYNFGAGGMPSDIATAISYNYGEKGRIHEDLKGYLVDGWDLNGDSFAIKESGHDLTNTGSTPFVKP